MLLGQLHVSKSLMKHRIKLQLTLYETLLCGDEAEL
jgi:hypothetical protein